jgi:hypothetical protein
LAIRVVLSNVEEKFFCAEDFAFSAVFAEIVAGVGLAAVGVFSAGDTNAGVSESEVALFD